MKWRGVESGTPIHGKSLCESCYCAHIMKGDAESEKITLCNASYNKPIEVPFRKITECSKYEERGKPSLFEMQKVAYVMITDPRGKPIGFKSNLEFRKQSGLDRDDELVKEPQ